MDRTEGGRDDRVVSLSRARRAPIPADIARIASHLANLLDDMLALRGTGVGVRDFAGSFLGVAPTELVAGSAALVGVRFHLAALALAEDLERHPPVATIGEDTEEPPRWERLDLGDSQPRVPVALAAACAADTLAPVPLVIAVERNWRDGGFHLVVYSRREDAPAGRAYLDDLTARSHTGANPYRAGSWRRARPTAWG